MLAVTRQIRQDEVSRQLRQRQQEHPLLQPALVSLSFTTFIIILILGPSIMAALETDDNNEISHLAKAKHDDSSLRSLGLTPKDDNQKQFYEYQNNAQDFHLYRNPNSQIHVMFQNIIDNQVSNMTTSMLRMECTEANSILLICSNDNVHYAFDIFLFEDANHSKSGYPTTLYTGIDGTYDPIEDITWEQDQSHTTSSMPTVHCSKALGIFVYCSDPTTTSTQNTIIPGISNGIVIGWIVGFGIIFLVVITLFIRQCCRRLTYRKRMIKEIASADVVKYSDNSYSEADDSTTEMFDFREDSSSSHEDEIDPTELREVDLTDNTTRKACVVFL